jgi:hypothetical protein
VFDPFDPAFIADPYPFYHRLRREDPVHRHPLGFYVLTPYDDVALLLRDERFGRGGYRALLAARFGGAEEEMGTAASMLFTDPPDSHAPAYPGQQDVHAAGGGDHAPGPRPCPPVGRRTRPHRTQKWRPAAGHCHRGGPAVVRTLLAHLGRARSPEAPGPAPPGPAAIGSPRGSTRPARRQSRRDPTRAPSRPPPPAP